jgi:hypothetical protein
MKILGFGKDEEEEEKKEEYIPPEQTQNNLREMLKWLLENPSIPLSFRKQFYCLWELVPFGNYEERDILYLMSKFREWCILNLWFIPEQRWGNLSIFRDIDSEEEIRVDLNLLLNQLEQLYFINLTRGKGGFLTKELNTSRFGYAKSENEEKKIWRLI